MYITKILIMVTFYMNARIFSDTAWLLVNIAFSLRRCTKND